jgi:fibronectin-binding autotransporter adhesin
MISKKTLFAAGVAAVLAAAGAIAAETADAPVTVETGTTHTLAGAQGADRPSDLVVEPGGTVTLEGRDATIGGLSGSGTVMNAGDAPATLTITGEQGGNNTYSGVITDGPGGEPLSIKKTGPTRQIITGPSMYSGKTSVVDGGLATGN